MKLQGKFELPAPPETVWNLLMDPEVLVEILPGCKTLKKTGDDEYAGVIEAKIGPIASRYTSTFRLVDKQPPRQYKLLIDGQGRGGFVRGEATVELNEKNGSTALTYSGSGAVGGTIARIGQRLVEAGVRVLISRGFAALEAKVRERLQQS